MMADLGQWLQANNGRGRIAGEWDCCAFPAAWAMANGLPDPMAAWRGAYSTEDAALGLISDAGGLLPLFSAGMEAAGIPPRVAEPALGDIGVLNISGHEAGAVFTGRRWAFIADQRMAYASIDSSAIAGVWAVAHG